jgi:radical SAM protein with 4Fe4S-binding SPASM domain
VSPPHETPWSPSRPHVHSLALELTGFCNQTCDYCYNAFRGDGGASVGSTDTATLIARLDRILDAIDLEHVTLTGGEPLASHELFPVLDALRRRNVRAQIISNASLVTDAIATRLARYRLLAVLVTLNAPDARTHDELVRTPGQFDKTVLGIERLVARRVPVQGSIVITRDNASLVGDTIAKLLSLGVRTIALSRFSPAGYSVAHAERLVPSPADVRNAFEAAQPFARDHGVRFFATMPMPPCVFDRSAFPEIAMNDCPIGTARQEFALGPRGEIRHCALHVEPIARDVLDPTLDLATLFAHGDPHGYRATLPTACTGCAHASSCGGGCGAAAWWIHGDRTRPDPFVSGLHEHTNRRLRVIG